MNILVTGGCGFIGSQMVRYLLEETTNLVVNVDSLSYAGTKANLSSVAGYQRYRFYQNDVCDQEAMLRILRKHAINVVMHFAAETHVDRSIINPRVFLQTNVRGTFNLLDSAKNYWFKQGKPENFRFHHVSTDEVFGSLGEDGYFSENTAYNPQNPYSASKASSDHLVRAWSHTYGLPISISNCSNNYGPFQFPEKLIPLMVINALNGEKLPVYGDGSNVRDWLYVEDHADAILTILKYGLPGRSYNIGCNNEISNMDLIKKICIILNQIKPNEFAYESLINLVTDRPGHDFRYAIDPTRLNSELNWRPSFSFEESLTKTIKWYIDNQDWWKPLIE